MTSTPVLGIVPARGGSKGVPGKNMRLLAGRPMLGYTLEAAQQSGVVDRLIVSSDDPRIRRWAALHGHETMDRGGALAGDEATIAAVAADVADRLDWSGTVAVFQPTSPLRSAESIASAYKTFVESGCDSLSSVIRSPHLHWYSADGAIESAAPLYAERVNRQYARHGVYLENGAIQFVSAAVLRSDRTMVSARHRLHELPPDEAVDIDTFDDFDAVRRRLERGVVVFRVKANATVGSGHLFHCLQLAEELADHEVRFLLVDCDPFVTEILDQRGLDHRPQTDLGADLAATAAARVVVNDVLDTSEAEVLVQRAAGWKVVNIEDLGPGARYADWVVNALYPPAELDTAVATGARYAPLRTEFAGLPAPVVRETPERVLVTFGGTDPSQLGPRVARVLAGSVGASVRVVEGPGTAPSSYPAGVDVVRDVESMAAEMVEADVVVTSAGRTVFEAAATGTPVVAIAQNARETTHSHLGAETGVLFLGLGAMVSDEQIRDTVTGLLQSVELRAELSERLRAAIDCRGAERIGDGIRDLLRDAWR